MTSMTAAESDTQAQAEGDFAEVKRLTEEFIERLQNIENEIETLKGDRKELFDEFKNKLDMKTLKAAMQIVKIKRGVAHKDTFDTFMNVLDPNGDEAGKD